MAYNYVAARKTMLRVITKYGQPGFVILKGTKAGPDDAGDTVPATPDTLINGKITPLVQYKTNEIDGVSILQGDAWVYFHSDTVIDIDMQTTVNGKTFRIVGTFPLSSVDDINIFQRLQLRK